MNINKTNKTHRYLSLLLVFAMVFCMLPLGVFADGEASAEPTKVSVNITAQSGSFFEHGPWFNLEVSSDTAENYGYTDSVKDGVSALDALVTIHEEMYAPNFKNDELKTSYLNVNENGYITTIFRQKTSANGFVLNGGYPNDGTVSQFGGYNGTTVTTQALKNNDTVEFFTYQDTSGWSDQLAWFNKDGVYASEVTGVKSSNVKLNLKTLSYMGGYLYKTPEDLRAAGSNGAGIQLAYVDVAESEVNEAITNIDGAVTDNDGNVTLTLPDTAGTYYLTAKRDGTLNPLVMSLTKVTVIEESAADCITVPSDAKLFVGQKDGSKHYIPFIEINSMSYKTDGDNTSYYFNFTDRKSYNYRISGEEYVTYGGTFTRAKGKKTVFSVTEDQLKPENKTAKTIDRDTNSNGGNNVADIYLALNSETETTANVNSNGYLKLAKDDTYQIVSLRNWEAVNTDTGNYFIEPDYHYEVIDANGNSSDVAEVDENGVLTAKNNGTAIVLVTYDAMTLDHGKGNQYTGFYGAIWPENTGVFVISVSDDVQESGIETGITLNKGENTKTNKVAEDKLDYEHDVIYYTGETGSYNFTPVTENVTVAVANPVVTETKLSYSGFNTVDKNDDNSYTVSLKEGKNIVKVEKDGKAEYQIITAKKVSVTVNAGEEVNPGDTITVTFDKLYHPVNKLAGVYNMEAAAVYTKVDGYDGKMVGGAKAQYNFASKAEAKVINKTATASIEIVESEWGDYNKFVYDQGEDIVVPADYKYDTFTLSGGMFCIGGYGDSCGNHSYVNYVTGKAPNLNADVVLAYIGSLPDIEIPIVATTAELDSISINTENAKTDYYAGDKFDASTVEVTAKYADEKTQIAKNFTVSPEVLTADTKKVIIEYKGKTAEIPVTVTEPKVTKIEVTTPPEKTEYKAGEVFNPTGMVVTATYDNDKKAETFDYSYAPARELATSDTEMTITYTGEHKTDEVTDVKQPITVTAQSGGSSSSSNISVYFTLLGDKKHGDPSNAKNTHTKSKNNLETWISRTKVTVPKNSKVIDVVEKTLGLNGIPFTNKGNYISEIKGLSEMDNGSKSGWMYTLNGKYTDYGVDEQKVTNGDNIVFHYTDDYSLENYSSGSSSSSSSGGSVSGIPSTNKNNGTTDDDKQDTNTDNTDNSTAVDIKNFGDVSEDDWFYTAIEFAIKNNLFKGVSETEFAPEDYMTRAMLVTVMYRLENADSASEENLTNMFTDVPDDEWYTKAVIWASNNGIVNGVTDTEFAPDENITREQMTAIIYRYAKFKGYDTEKLGDISSYTDVSDISDWAEECFRWAIETGIINGTTDSTLSPLETATRAQVATILMRFCGINK